MKRRNFLPGLLAAPLALKARLAQFFGRKAVCNAPIGNVVLWKQPEPHFNTFPNGPAMILALQKGIPTRILLTPVKNGAILAGVRRGQ